MAKKAPPTDAPADLKVEELQQAKILRAYKPGDVLILETERMLSVQQMQHYQSQLKALLPEIRFVILNAGVRVAAREESPSDDLDAYRELERTVRDFLEHVRRSHDNPPQTENPRAELGLILAMSKALEALS